MMTVYLLVWYCALHASVQYMYKNVHTYVAWTGGGARELPRNNEVCQQTAAS
jgi:hypothetical protein